MGRELPPRLPRPPTADAVVAACIAVLGVVEVAAAPDIETWPAGPLMLVAGTALAWRCRAPFTVFLISVGAVALSSHVATPVDSLVVILPVIVLAVYSLGAHAAPRLAVAGLLLCLGFALSSTFADEGPGISNLLFGLVTAVSPWLAGWMVRRRTEQAVEAGVRAQELEHTQLERQRQAVLAERARIARELHDVIAHSVSVMTIQAGAVEEVVDRDPARARAAAAAIRETGQRSQVDLRRLLGVLREDDVAPASTSPQPTLADLGALVQSVRETGMDVRLRIDGARRDLPPALELSAFRVVQEALTNTLKHASATGASVAVRLGADAVDIEVVDDGVANGTSAGGHGLVGMRERVAVYGGELTAGPAPGGGFRVRALLPVRGDGG